MRLSLLATVAAVAVTMAIPAQAATLLFTLTGSRDATFQLESNPTPTTFSSSVFGDQIQFANVAGTFGGVDGVAPSIGFGSGLFASLNINGTPLGFTQFAGPSLFSGTADAPVFAPGVFNLTSIVSGSSTLTISSVDAGPGGVGAVPEPAAWALMIGGFGLAGASLRRRRASSLALARA